MNKIYLIRPYAVGKDKKSLAMVLPSELVKTLEIEPQVIFLSIKVMGVDNLLLQIIRQSDLERKDVGNSIPIIKKTQLRKQEPSIEVKKEGVEVEEN